MVGRDEENEEREEKIGEREREEKMVRGSGRKKLV